jgi:hypothetical protein
MLNEIFEAVHEGNLPRFKGMLCSLRCLQFSFRCGFPDRVLISYEQYVAVLVMLLDMGRGRLREAVEALRVEDEGLMKGLCALHIAAIRGRLQFCSYLVEDLGVDANVADEHGQY